jgi:hypothetical protein
VDNFFDPTVMGRSFAMRGHDGGHVVPLACVVRAL